MTRSMLSLLLLCATGHAENILTVCASGCGYPSVQAAINAAATGSIIELKAGEVFTENVVIIGKRNLRIRTSRWRELPPTGYRIHPETHAQLLATIRTSNSVAALSIGPEGSAIHQDGVDTATDTVTFDYAPPLSTFSEGSAISCIALVQNLGSLPAPIVYGRKYFIRDWNAGARRGRIAETPGGAAIDLTTAGSASSSNYYGRPQCTLWEQSKQLSFEGIRFDTTSTAAAYTLVQVGHNLEAKRQSMGPAKIEFRHSVISGVPENQNGPLLGLSLNGSDLLVRDSWIGHCKRIGQESKAIAIGNVTGAVITNNYLSAASIIILTAGGDAAAMDVNRSLVITGNFLEKPGYMMYKQGSGPPAGECYYGGGSGSFYRRTDVTPNTCAGGACYTCSSSNAWEPDTNAPYRSGNYYTKNMLELKDCEDCRIEGNYFQGGYAGPDSGQGWCLGISVVISPPGFSGGGSGYHHAHNVTFRNNWADSCYSGIHMSHSSYGGSFDQLPLRNITLENNLFTNLGWYPALTQFSDPDTVLRFSLKQSTGIAGFHFRNNTLRARSGYHTGVVLFPGAYPDRRMPNYYFENNLISFQSYSFRLDSWGNACTPDGLFQWIPNDGFKHFRNNVFFGGSASSTFLSYTSCNPVNENLLFQPTGAGVGFQSAADSRLASTSPYSASNPNAVLTSTNTGADLGADIDAIEQYAIPARDGEPSMPDQLRLNIIPGSRAALFRFRQPVDAACQVTLYNGARIASNEISDTGTAAKKQSGRLSSLVDGRSVVFLAGSETALTPAATYGYRLDCGAKWAVGTFQTRAEGGGAVLSRQLQDGVAASAQLEYSPSPDFSSSTLTTPVAFSAGKVRVEAALASGYHYWRWRLLDSGQNVIRTGPAGLFVAP